MEQHGTTRVRTQRGASRSLHLLRVGILAGMVGLLATPAVAQVKPETDDEKALYTIGVSIAAQLDPLKPITDRELELVIQGLRDRVDGGTLAVDPAESRSQVRTLLEERSARAQEAEKQASAAFVAEQASRKGASQTESGLVFTELEAGRGKSPGPSDRVKVHYHGTLRDGTVFDSSVERGTPAEFPLNRVIDCWTEGLTMMKEGGKARLVCPAAIAYGDRGFQGRIPAGAALTFEVELIEILE